MSPWKVSSSVSPSEIEWSFDVEANRMHMAVLPCQFTRKGQLYATVQIGNEVVEVLVVFSRKRGFQLRVRQRRGIDELLACCPPAAEPPRKQTCNRRTLVF